MPKPIPTFIPAEIEAKIIKGGFAGVMDYSEHIGLNAQRLISVFGGKNTKLKPYRALAEYSNKTMDQLAAMIEVGTIGQFIENLAKKENISVRQLSLRIGASEDFLGKRIRAGKYTNGLQNYIEVAEALGWSLEKLSKHCLN